MCDLLELVINDLSIKNYSTMQRSDCKQIWVYKDLHAEYHIIIFPTDLLYINLFKGPRLFIRYIKNKLGLLTQQSNNQSHDSHN
jgi:hypothetical protein